MEWKEALPLLQENHSEGPCVGDRRLDGCAGW